MIGVYLIINGLGNANSVNNQDNLGYVLPQNSRSDNNSEQVATNPPRSNNSWGKGISALTPKAIDRVYSLINYENRSQVGYFDLNGNFNILYDLNEKIEDIDIFSTAEIAFITKKDSFNQQKLVKKSTILTEEVILPVNFFAKGVYFNISEFTFYIYGEDQERNFIIYTLLNNDSLQEVIKTKSLPENTKIIMVNSSKSIVVQAGSDCVEIKLSDKSFSKVSCSSSTIGSTGYSILIEKSNVSLIDSNSKAKTILFPKNSAVNYEKFWISNKKIYWLERPFTSPNSIKIEFIDIQDLKAFSQVQNLFEDSINSTAVDLMFIGEKLFMVLDKGVIIEKVIDENVLQSANFVVNYRDTNWQDWYQLILNVGSVSDVQILEGDEATSFIN